MATLIVQTGGVDQVVELGERTLIGRHPTNDVQILDENVSGRHCLIELSNGAYHVRDLNSLNGTFVNRLRNDGNAERLFHHDLIGVGGTTLRFDDESAGVRPRSAEEELEALKKEFAARLRRRSDRGVVWPSFQPDRDPDLQAERDSLRLFWETAEALLAASDDQALLDAALYGAIRICGGRGGAIRIYDEVGGYRVAAVRGAPSDGPHEDVARARAHRTPVARRSSHPGQPWVIVIPMCDRAHEHGLLCVEAERGNDLRNVQLAETIASLTARFLSSRPAGRTLH